MNEQDALDGVPQSEADWEVIKATKRHLAVHGASQTAKLLAEAREAVQPTPKPARAREWVAPLAAKPIRFGALLADREAIRRAGEHLMSPSQMALDDMAERIRDANLLAPVTLSDAVQTRLDNARKALLLGDDSNNRNSRLAEALKTKRNDIRDPNEGAHPRIRERAESAWRERVQGLNHDG